jgi:uncharacterized protein YqcC (DUF446 family)
MSDMGARMKKTKELGRILQSLQRAMIEADHWSEAAINPASLNSQQPFCLDTMTFSQWLQFVMIPTMQRLIDTNQVLPQLIKDQGIEPMARESYSSLEVEQAIVAKISELDNLLQDNPSL